MKLLLNILKIPQIFLLRVPLLLFSYYVLMPLAKFVEYIADSIPAWKR